MELLLVRRHHAVEAEASVARLDVPRVARADGRHRVGVVDRALHEVHLSVEFEGAPVGVRAEAPAVEAVVGEEPLVRDVVYRVDGVVVGCVSGVVPVPAQRGGYGGRRPVVRVDYVGLPLRRALELHRGEREEEHRLRRRGVEHVGIYRLVRVKLVVLKDVDGRPRDARAPYARRDGFPVYRRRHGAERPLRQRAHVARLVEHAGPRGGQHARVYPEAAQRLRQRARDVAEAALLRERRALRRDVERLYLRRLFLMDFFISVRGKQYHRLFHSIHAPPYAY